MIIRSLLLLTALLVYTNSSEALDSVERPVLLLNVTSPFLENCTSLGVVEVRSREDEEDCDLLSVIDALKRSVRGRGGDVLVITDVTENPTAEHCVRVKGLAYSFGDGVSWPTHGNTRPSKAVSGGGSDVSVDEIERDWELHVRLLSDSAEVTRTISNAYSILVIADSTLHEMEFTAFISDPRRSEWPMGSVKAGFRKTGPRLYAGVWFTGSFVEKQITARVTEQGDLVITYPISESEQCGVVEIASYSDEHSEGDSVRSNSNVHPDPEALSVLGVEPDLIIDRMPEFKKTIAPEYPALAMRGSIEGTVFVKVLIDTLGKVRDAVVVKSSGLDAGFEESALRAARQCEFTPAISQGKLTEVWVTFPFKFALSR